MKKKLILIGGGGHAKVVIDAVQKNNDFSICGVVDVKKESEEVMGIPVVGSDDNLAEIYKNIRHAFITVGSIGDCAVRKAIYDKLNKRGFKLPVIVHPNAVIADDVKLDEGTFVAAGAVINPGTRIGKNVIVNTKASIDHDCSIGDFVHIAPGVTISGCVNVGSETHIGTGANVIQCLKIGNRCFIKAGQIVKNNIKDGKRYGSSKA